MGYFGLKMACCHNSGSALRTFLKFCIMKGAKIYMKISLMVFQKNVNVLGKLGHFGPKNGLTS